MNADELLDIAAQQQPGDESLCDALQVAVVAVKTSTTGASSGAIITLNPSCAPLNTTYLLLLINQSMSAILPTCSALLHICLTRHYIPFPAEQSCWLFSHLFFVTPSVRSSGSLVIPGGRFKEPPRSVLSPCLLASDFSVSGSVELVLKRSTRTAENSESSY